MAWTNEKVRRHWRLTTKASTEARASRLKWLQELSERSHVHCQILAALFGDIPFENTRSSNEGRIIGPLGPWARRLIEDLSSLSHSVDGGEDFLEDLDSRWPRPLCDTEEAERFRRLDVAEIRARCIRGARTSQGSSSLGPLQKTPAPTVAPRSPAGSQPSVTSFAPIVVARTAEPSTTGGRERTYNAGSATSGARVRLTFTRICAHISHRHDPLSRFSGVSNTISSAPMLTDGSAATTTGWQLSVGGAAGAASSTTENKSKKLRVSVVDTTDSSGTQCHSEQGESQRKNDEGQGPGGPDHDCDGTSRAAVGPTAQGLGSIIIGHILGQLDSAHHSRREGSRTPVLLGDTECDGTAPRTRSPRIDRFTGVSPESDDPSTRSSGYPATAGAMVGPGHTQTGGRSHHSHESLPDTSDRDLSFTSESTRRKPAESYQSVSLRHGRQAYGRHCSSQSQRERTLPASQPQPEHVSLTQDQPQIVFSYTTPPVSQLWSQSIHFCSAVGSKHRVNLSPEHPHTDFSNAESQGGVPVISAPPGVTAADMDPASHDLPIFSVSSVVQRGRSSSGQLCSGSPCCR